MRGEGTHRFGRTRNAKPNFTTNPRPRQPCSPPAAALQTLRDCRGAHDEPSWLSRLKIYAMAAFIFLLTTLAPAQDSQFLFDANGNLQVQAPEISALPQITHQPQNSVVESGETAGFSVLETGTLPLTFQ